MSYTIDCVKLQLVDRAEGSENHPTSHLDDTSGMVSGMVGFVDSKGKFGTLSHIPLRIEYIHIYANHSGRRGRES